MPTATSSPASECPKCPCRWRRRLAGTSAPSASATRRRSTRSSASICAARPHARRARSPPRSASIDRRTIQGTRRLPAAHPCRGDGAGQRSISSARGRRRRGAARDEALGLRDGDHADELACRRQTTGGFSRRTELLTSALACPLRPEQLPRSIRSTRSHAAASRGLCVAMTEVSPCSACISRKQIMQRVGGALVEVSCRLVGQQQRRAHHQRSRDGDALLLAARHHARSMLRAFTESDARQQFRRPAARLAQRTRARCASASRRSPPRRTPAAGDGTGRRSRRCDCGTARAPHHRAPRSVSATTIVPGVGAIESAEQVQQRALARHLTRRRSPPSRPARRCSSRSRSTWMCCARRCRSC